MAYHNEQSSVESPATDASVARISGPSSVSAQHTPGPWRVVKGRTRYDVRSFADPRFGAGGQCITEHFDNDPEALANATLRAAAPDLLAALESVADYWAGGDVPPDIDAAMRAAIAKARGQA